MADLKVFAEQ
jgi:large subunit ribosomal protein L7/L12